MAYRAALITGASSGIGASFAALLPPETDLLLTGRDPGRLEALAATLIRPGRRVETLVADLGTEEGIAVVSARAEAFGIDLLVNNAGLGRFGRFMTNEPSLEREMVMVNVLAPVVLTRALLPGMLARAKAPRVVESGGRAGIIIVGSVVSFAAFPFFATYAATKAFDVRLAQALAAELAREPVDVLALCPGATETRFFERSRFARSQGASNGHSPDRVAREGLAALGRRRLHVVGAANSMLTMLMKLMPGSLMTRLLALALRPKKNP